MSVLTAPPGGCPCAPVSHVPSGTVRRKQHRHGLCPSHAGWCCTGRVQQTRVGLPPAACLSFFLRAVNPEKPKRGYPCRDQPSPCAGTGLGSGHSPGTASIQRWARKACPGPGPLCASGQLRRCSEAGVTQGRHLPEDREKVRDPPTAIDLCIQTHQKPCLFSRTEANKLPFLFTPL